MNFVGKVALVTGGSTGIGRATRLALARGGAVVAVDYSQSVDDAEKTVQSILDLGGEALMVRCDVSKDQWTILNPAKGSHESHDHS